MDIDKVRYLCVFAETGSLVKASEILHISQPALSKAFRVLEQEVGEILLEPDGRGLRLTSKGQILVSEAKPLIENWNNLPKRIHGFSSRSAVRLSSFEVFTTYFLETLLLQVKDFDFEVHQNGPGKIEKAVATGEVDVGITYVPVPTAGIEFIEVTKIKMGVYGLPHFLNTNFQELPFAIPLLPADGMPSKVVGLDGWPDHKVARLVKYKVTVMESALELCRRGRSVAYLPDFIVRIHNECVARNFQLVEIKSPVSKKESSQGVFLVKRKQENESSFLRAVAKALRSLS